MANTLAALLKCTSSSLTQHLNKITFTRIVQPQIVRTLYSKSSLGLDGYKQQCEKTKVQLATIADKFKTKMKEYAQEDSKSMVFTEDLKNMVHITETDEEVQTVIQMMKKFNSQNQSLRFGNFIFGPVVMRMFYALNKYEEALQCFKTEELKGFFDQLVTYQLLMDLLYENGKYQDVLDVFEIIKGKQLEGSKYPRNIVVLTLAACYKLNTEESLQYALKLWSDLNAVGHQSMRRAVTFCAGLALMKGQASAALEIAGTAKNQNYTTIRNIKVAALVELGRLEDALLILKAVLEHDGPENKQTFNKDVLDKFKNAVEKSDSSELKTDLERIQKHFAEGGNISEKTLDEQLCVEIVTPNFMSNPQRQTQFSRFQRSSFGNQNRTRNYNERPGLSELQ